MKALEYKRYQSEFRDKRYFGEKGEKDLKLYFIQNNNNIVVNPLKISNIIKQKFSPSSDFEIENIRYKNDEWKWVDLNQNDVVILALGHLFNPTYVQTDITEQIKYFLKKKVKVAIATEYRHFNYYQNYFDKDADGLAVHNLAWKYRLPVLDSYSFLNSWYLENGEIQRQRYLKSVKDQDNELQLRLEEKQKLFDHFIANWLYRKFIKNNKSQYLYGASIYPEVWNEKINEEDMKHIEKMGFNTVRIGEFFWDELEPEENHYELNYLRNLLEKLKRHHLKVIVGIPSPTPPRWFTLHYPEARIVNKDGQIDEHGSRQHVCTNNVIFRKKVYQLTKKIAEVVNEFDNIVAIQIDNEYKCHVDQCFCESCRKLWSRWLKEKYDTIDNLNECWGTNLWSERYPSFESVVMPTKTPFIHNTALKNAFADFTADTLNDFASGTIQILIANTRVPITHNSSMNFNLNNFELFNQLDIAGYDTYPRFNQYWNFPINLDLFRNVKDNNNFYLLETCTSHVGYIGNYVPPYPKGYLPTEVFLGYAAGLNSFLYWPYRAQRVGVEQTHSAVVTQAGTPDLGYDDVLKGEQILKKIKPILAKTTIRKAKVAIIYSDETKRRMNTESGGIYQYRSAFTKVYEAITRRGISVEVIQPNADFNKFNCIIAPYLRSISTTVLNKFKTFVKGKDKQLILGPLTGDRTPEGNWHYDNGLGRLGNWLGVKDVVQYLSSEDKTAARVRIDKKEDRFSDLVTLFETDHEMEGVQTVAPVAGKRSITFQNENIIYIGGMPEDCMESCFWDYVVDKYIRPKDDQIIERMDDGIYKYERENEKEIFIFIANMSDQLKKIKINKEKIYTEDDKKMEIGLHNFEPYSYKVLKIQKERK